MTWFVNCGPQYIEGYVTYTVDGSGASAQERSVPGRRPQSVTGLPLSLNGIPGGRWCELLPGGCG